MKAALPFLLLLAVPLALQAQPPGWDGPLDELVAGSPRQGSQELPHLATAPSGETVVSWMSSGSLYARRFAADGSPATGEVLVSEEAFPSFQASAVALTGDGSFVVAFSRGTPGSRGSTLEVRGYGPGGSPRSAAVVSRQAVTDVAIAPRPAGGFVLAWQSGERPSVHARAFGPDHAPLGPEVLVGRQGTSPVVATGPGGGFVVAWNDRSRVSVRRFADDGAAVGGAVAASGAEGPIHNLRIGADAEGNALVLWWASAGPLGKGAFLRRFGPDGQPRGVAIPLSLIETGPPLSLAVGPRGDFVLAWNETTVDRSDILARRFSADGAVASPVIRVNAEGPGTRGLAQAGILADHEFIVVWQSDERAERSNEIFARRFEESEVTHESRPSPRPRPAPPPPRSARGPAAARKALPGQHPAG